MTQMDHAAFNGANSITELDINEIGQVDGGGVGIVVAVVVVGLLAIGYLGEHNRDNDEAKTAE